MTQGIANFTLQIVDAAVTGDELDDLARHLMLELKEMEVESVALASGGRACGDKIGGSHYYGRDCSGCSANLSAKGC